MGFSEVTDARLGHDGDGDGLHDPGDHLRIRHASDATLGTDVCGHSLEGHDGHGSDVLGDFGLLSIDDVHDHAALEHLRHAPLDAVGSYLLVHLDLTRNPMEFLS